MPQREEMQKQLAGMRQKGWVAERLKAMSGTPGFEAWLKRPAVSDVDWESEREGEDERFTLVGLSDTERKRVLGVLFPRLGEWVERAWQSAETRPAREYGAVTRVLRAPRHAGLLRTQRAAFIGWLVRELRGFDPDPVWLAMWAGHLGDQWRWPRGSAWVLAAVIDGGGEQGEAVLEILRASAAGRHEVAVMGEHLPRALLASASPAAWEEAVKLLLAAQRQEGLRQSILQAAGAGHPLAMARVLKVIAEERLTRFASVVQELNEWFGFAWDSSAGGHVQTIAERASLMLEDERAREAAISGKDAESACIGLWSMGVLDAESMVERCKPLLTEKKAERRWLGASMIGMARVPGTAGLIEPLLEDEDWRVVATALDGVFWIDGGRQMSEIVKSWAKPEEEARRRRTFGRLAALLDRIEGKQVEFKPMVFPWAPKSLAAESVASQLVWCSRPTDAAELTRRMDRFDKTSREQALMVISGFEVDVSASTFERKKNKPRLAPGAVPVLVKFLGDQATWVRETVTKLLSLAPVTAEEIARQEDLLQRSTGDVRTTAVRRLMSQGDKGVLASARRLMAGKKPQREAGVELLKLMVTAKRSVAAAKAVAAGATDAASAAAGSKKGEKSTAKDGSAAGVGATEGLAKVAGRAAGGARAGAGKVIDATAAIEEAARVHRVDDAFGLASPVTPRPVPKLRATPKVEWTRASVEVLWSLERFIEANKEVELAAADGGMSSDDRLLGALRWTAQWRPRRYKTLEADRAGCKVVDLLTSWEASRGAETRDKDGLELLRAWLIVERSDSPDYRSKTAKWVKVVKQWAPAGCKGGPKHYFAIELLLQWALRLGTVSANGVIFDQIERAIMDGHLFWASEGMFGGGSRADRDSLSAVGWFECYDECPAAWLDAEKLENVRRREGLGRAADAKLDELIAKTPAARRKSEDWQDRIDRAGGAYQVDASVYATLFDAGDIGEDELLIWLAEGGGEEEDRPRSVSELASLFSRRLPRNGAGKGGEIGQRPLSPRLDALLEKLRKRVLEIELARGELPTVATPHAMAMNPSGGVDAAVGAMATLGKGKLHRGHVYSDAIHKSASMSRIIQHSRPGAGDTPEAFAAAAKAAGLSDQRLVELAVYQPRWAAHVEKTLGWAGLEEAVLWVRAHTKGAAESSDPDEAVEPWEARVAELTPISGDSRKDGAVDRAWFERGIKALGAKRWEVVYEAAKYASSGAGHTRVRLFADAMTGKVSEKELVKRVESKRNQDAARALGLLAVKAGEGGKQQVLERYRVLVELRRTSRKHGGSMLQASEKRAVEVGLENLAWTAGYPDPLRLEWAMEIEELGDLAKGPMTVKAGAVAVTLRVTEEGVAELTAEKDGKTLKSVPPAVKKEKNVAELAERQVSLRRQSSRMRQGLEGAMCRGDEFAGSELAMLHGHPLLASMLSRLVLVGKTKGGAALMGYADKGGRALRGVDGTLEPVGAGDRLRVAHPLDLLSSGTWTEWQRECFKAERVQPFKQVFREVYVPVERELAAKGGGAAGETDRYSGQQVQPRQAMALFGTRGWVARAEEGVQRTFHREGVTVAVRFMEGFYSPAEVDGWTVEGLGFRRAGTGEPLAIKAVPARVFSEVMRDLDLVVSVAHRGQVDPEASHSTVEMRASLVRETCTLLGLSNVRQEKNRLMIKGELGDYALHLGSGEVQRLPGGSVWIVPVHSQHRGRLFLPFADNDPKTAEIVSKVLLLARDREIQDPTILSQLRG